MGKFKNCLQANKPTLGRLERLLACLHEFESLRGVFLTNPPKNVSVEFLQVDVLSYLDQILPTQVVTVISDVFRQVQIVHLHFKVLVDEGVEADVMQAHWVAEIGTYVGCVLQNPVI